MAPRLRPLVALAWLAACAPPPAPPPAPPAPAPPPRARPAPAPPCERILSIEVRKAERRLEARCEGGGRVAWTVALGRVAGPKRSAGDMRTPEGLYRVAAPARPSRFHRFLPIDYPSREDAERAAREDGLPSEALARIAASHARGEPPPQDTPLGGNLGFHGEGARWHGDSADLDWTTGCIAMPDERLDFLAERAPPGTPVRIAP